MIEYYKILGLNPGATMNEVIEAYTRLATKNNPSNGGSLYIFNMIHFAYNEIINNFNNPIKKEEQLRLMSYDIEENIQEGEIEHDINNPTPIEICQEVYKVFSKCNTNPFLKDNKYDLLSIINCYNGFQNIKKENKKYFEINSNDLTVRKSLFKKVDVLSKVGPAIDLSLYICNLYNYNVDNDESKTKIRMMMIKEAAKDIIAKNGGMVLNEES